MHINDRLVDDCLTSFITIDSFPPMPDSNLQFLYDTEPLPTSSQVVIVPIPLERTTSFIKGTRFGPEQIIAASHQVEFFDPEFVWDASNYGITTDWSLGQDMETLNSQDIEVTLAMISEKVASILAHGQFPLALGGEHTITAGLVGPIISQFKNDLTILQIDAHADLKETYHNSRYSHACVIRRICDRVPVVSVGIRSLDHDEYIFANQSNNISTFFAHKLKATPYQQWVQDVVGTIKTKYVYLTFDLDGFDPSVVPGLGTPEPGGILWHEAMALLKQLTQKHILVGADVNEIAPCALPYASLVAARLAYKIAQFSRCGVGVCS